ncbi:MAG TPA: hypothetical protein VGN17_15010 [Bryobacteraceae bacterium]|jgi:hypothetical protein
MHRAFLGAAALGIILATSSLSQGLSGAFDGSPDHPAIHYERPSQDPVAALNRRIQEGSLVLKSEETTGYLRSVLDALNIPVESQIVAMSKTSVQQYIIGPHNPRMLYFNDSIAVGFVPNGFIELAAQDPQQGIVFYTLGRNYFPGRGRVPQSISPLDKPTFQRDNSCLGCHVSYSSLDVPGTLLRSVYPGPSGEALYQAGSYLTDHRSPMQERFGGWYVTGASGPARHLGNALFTDPDRAEAPTHGEILGSLKDKFDTRFALTPYSDIVALLVFNHQMRMMNLLTRVGWEARYGAYEKLPDLPQRLEAAAREFVDYLLFVDEAPLTAKIQGSSGYTEKFAAQGPRDKQGRSLREFDLDRRLMRYPCSYMIYSEAFDSLPPEARDAIYHRMWTVLSGSDRAAKYATLTLADRRAIVEILRDTKPGLPDYFRPVTN